MATQNHDDDGPLDASTEERLRNNLDFLVTNIDTEPILQPLCQSTVISQEKKDEIMAETTPARQAGALIDVIRRGSRLLFAAFLNTLERSNQHEVLKIVQSPQMQTGAVAKVTSRLLATVRRHEDTMISNIRFDGSLLLHLFSQGVLTEIQMHDLNAIPNRMKRAEALLAYVKRGASDEKLERFADVLGKTDQNHLKNLIIREDVSDVFSDANRRALQTQLVENVDIAIRTGLIYNLQKLVAIGAVTASQKEEIQQEKTKHARAELLLDIMQCRPVSALHSLQQCTLGGQAFLEEKPLPLPLLETRKEDIPQFESNFDAEVEKGNSVKGLNEMDNYCQRLEENIVLSRFRKDEMMSHLSKLDLPLCEEDKRRLMSCTGFVEYNLGPDGVINSLWLKGALSYREKEDLGDIGPRYEKAGRLIESILRGSQRTYDLFIQALIDDNQRHIVDKIENTSVAAPTQLKRESRKSQNQQSPERTEDVTDRETQVTKNFQIDLKASQRRECQSSNQMIQREFGLNLGTAVFFITLLMVPRHVQTQGREDGRQHFEQQPELYVEMPNLFTPDEDGKLPRKVLILGAAGSGKTTLLQHACVQWADDKLWTEFRYVFHLTCRRLHHLVEKRTEISLLDLVLTHGVKPAEVDKITIKRELISNPQRILLVIDGLDEIVDWETYSPQDKPPVDDVQDKAEIPFLLHSIMYGNLVEESHVLFTSRPIDRIETDRFDTTVRIYGFGRESIAKCILALSGGDEDKCRRVLEYLAQRPHLHLFCTLPLGCIMTGKVVLDELESSKEDRKQHETIDCATLLLIRVLIVLFTRRSKRNSHLTDRFSIINIMRGTLLKIMKLAAWGTLRESPQLIFNSQSLIDHHIDQADLHCGLIDIDAQKIDLTKIQADCTCTFLHYSVQEFLSALHIVLTWKAVDIQMITSRRSSNKYDMVLLYVSGLLGNPMGHKLINALDEKLSALRLTQRLKTLFNMLVKEYKGRFSLSFLPDITKKGRESSKLMRLQLLRCVAEGNQGSMVVKIDSLVLSSGTLDLTRMPGGLLPEHLPAVAFYLQWSSSVSAIRLDIRDCFGLMSLITADNKARLVPLLDGCVLHRWDDGQDRIREGGLELVGKSLLAEEVGGLGLYVSYSDHIQCLSLTDCGITDQGAAFLASAVKVNTSLEVLSLGFNEITDNSVPGLASAVESNRNLTLLSLDNNMITDEGVSALASAVQENTNLKLLSLWNNNLSGGMKEQLVEMLGDQISVLRGPGADIWCIGTTRWY